MGDITLQNPEQFAAAWPGASAIPSDFSTTWLVHFPARSNHSATRLVRLTGRLYLPIAWLAASTAWFAHLRAWLVDSAVWLAHSTAPINHLTARIIRPAVRLSAKNRAKPPKTAFSAWAARQSRQRLGLRQPSGALDVINSGRGLPHSKTLRTFQLSTNNHQLL